jgi:peptide deformylase
MPKVLNILIVPSKTLRKISAEVEEGKISGQELRELAADLEETMIKKEGVGLAAPQVGKNIRLIAVNAKNGPILLFNPKIIKKSWRQEWGEEGCLSVPLVFGDVKRHKSVICAFCDRQGKKDKIKAFGLLARVIQHEIDHLDGVLFIDNAKNVKIYDTKEKTKKNK